MADQENVLCCGKIPLRKGCFYIGMITSIVYFIGFCYDLYWVITVPRTMFSYFFIFMILIGETLNIAAGPLLVIGAKKYKSTMLMLWILAGLINVKINMFRTIFTVSPVLKVSACMISGTCAYPSWFLPLKVSELLMILGVVVTHLFFIYNVYKLWKVVRANNTDGHKKLEESPVKEQEGEKARF